MNNGYPSQALIYVYEVPRENSRRAQGIILDATGDFQHEMREVGRCLDDHTFEEQPTTTGLQMFVGWVEVGPGDDPDVTLVGSWSPLTHWEMCCVRFGNSPFARGAKSEPSTEPAPALPEGVRTLDEWHDDVGEVLWWTFPITEAPYVGSPLDTDWPGYHTHWTKFVVPVQP